MTTMIKILMRMIGAAGGEPRAPAGPGVPRPDPPRRRRPARASAAADRPARRQPVRPRPPLSARSARRPISAAACRSAATTATSRTSTACARATSSALFGPGTEVLMFAMTSGTTNRPKTIPVTPEALSDYREGWTIWGILAFDAHPEMLRDGLRPILQIASDWRESFTPGGHSLRRDHRADRPHAEPPGPHQVLHAGRRVADQGHRVEVLRRASVLDLPRPGHDHRRQSQHDPGDGPAGRPRESRS